MPLCFRRQNFCLTFKKIVLEETNGEFHLIWKNKGKWGEQKSNQGDRQ
jgi:hypothetical protein